MTGGERDSEFCLDLYRKGRRRREVFQLNADYIALSRYWKYIDTPLRPSLYLYRGRTPGNRGASHIIGQARVESFSPTRIIETSVNNDSAISRCITKQTRSGITPGLSPLFFPSTSFSLRRLFKPSAGCRLAAAAPIPRGTIVRERECENFKQACTLVHTIRDTRCLPKFNQNGLRSVNPESD